MAVSEYRRYRDTERNTHIIERLPTPAPVNTPQRLPNRLPNSTPPALPALFPYGLAPVSVRTDHAQAPHKGLEKLSLEA